MSPELDRRIPAALLILRFFLAIFLLQWSIEKLILPDAAARIARGFYGLTLAAPASYALGVAELTLSVALLFGFYRGRELAAIIRPMGTGQGRQPSVDFDVADLGRLCGAVPDADMG